MWKWIPLGLATFLAACGDSPQPQGQAEGTDGGTSSTPAKADPAPPPAPEPAVRAALESEVARLQQEAKALEDEASAMAKRHAEERASLPSGQEKTRFQGAYQEKFLAAKKAQHEYARATARFEELKGLAQSQVSAEVAKARAALDEVTKERQQIHEAWQAEYAAALQGQVDAAPALKHLLLLRNVKDEWFKATAHVRRGDLDAAARKRVSDGFRSYVSGDTERKALVASILAHDIAKGKSVDSYDFADLGFFLLMHLREDALARENIERERKELSAVRARLDAVEKKLDAAERAVQEKLAAGGDEFSEFEDLRSRIPHLKQDAEDKSEWFQTLLEIRKQMDTIDERQSRERQELEAKIAAAAEQLKAAKAKLSRSG